MNYELTVLMPVYNCESYISQAIESILCQTYKDFIFYIVDDGSTDNSALIIEEYAKLDDRILFIKQENKGLICTLNTHLPKINTKYVARMDGDDVCTETRLQQQIDFLNANNTVGVVGTGIIYMDEELKNIIYYSRFPDTHNLITWAMLYKTGIGHANIMMKTELFQRSGGYREFALHVEDYDFFLRLSEITKLANINEYLYKYRRHTQSVSLKYRSVQKKNHFSLTKKYLKKYVPEATDEFVEFFKNDTVEHHTNLHKIYYLLKALYDRFTDINLINPSEKRYIKNVMGRKMFVLAASYRKYSFRVSLTYFLKYLAFKWLS